MLASTTQLNTPGVRLGRIAGVHALTDVTGFGLLGHLLEVCRGSRLGARIDWDGVPLLPDVPDLLKQGYCTGASARNWAGYGRQVELGSHGDTVRDVLTDPQTSGGLLVTCAPDSVEEVVRVFRDESFDRVAVIGEMVPGEPRVAVV